MIKKILQKLCSWKISLCFCALILFLLPVAFGTVLGGTGDSIAITYAATDANNGCGLLSLGQCIINAVGFALVNFSAFFLWLAGELLDIAFSLTVIDFGINMNNYLGTSINEIWKVIRDICNLAFVFGLIYLGMMSVFDSKNAQVKSTLSKIIIGALLINFSLFFVKVVIDISNFLSVQIYNSLTVNGAHSISEIVTNQLGLITLYDNNGLSDRLDQFLNGSTSFTFFLMASVFIGTTAFVFFVAAILVVIRFVYLLYIMIASPILFGATIFPQTAPYARALWQKLIQYAFFLPSYLLLMYISLKTVSALNLNTTGFSAVLLQTGNKPPTDIEVILNFIVIIFFMISSLTIAQKIGIQGSDRAIKTGGAIVGGIQGYLGRGAVRGSVGVTRGVATAGLGTVNAVRGEDTPFKSAYASTSNIQMKNLSKLQDKLRKSDSKTKNATAWAMRATGAEAGIQAVNKAKFGSDESIADVDKRNAEINRARLQSSKDTKRDEAIRVGAPLIGVDGADKAKLIEMERAIAGMSETELTKALSGKSGDDRAYQAMVSYMTPEKFDKIIENSGETALSAKEKTQLTEARQTALAKSYGNISDSNAGNIRKMSSAELAQLNPVLLREHAGELTKKQVDDLKLTRTQKDEFKKIRQEKLKTKYSINENSPGKIGSLTNDELGELDKKTLTQWAHHLTKKQIDGLKEKTSGELTEIKNERKNKINTEANSGGVQNILNRFKDVDDLAQMPSAVFVAGTADKNTVSRFTVDVLKKAATNSDIDAVRTKIKENILLHYKPSEQSRVVGTDGKPIEYGNAGNKTVFESYQKYFDSPTGSVYNL